VRRAIVVPTNARHFGVSARRRAGRAVPAPRQPPALDNDGTHRHRRILKQMAEDLAEE